MMVMTASTHENFDRRSPAKPGSDRGFGIVMAVVFLLLAGAKLWAGRPSWPAWAAVATAFAGAAWLSPNLLAPLNRLWFRFGLLLHHVISPLVLALVFFGTFMPI